MGKYVIVGNGVAGTTAAETIRKLDKNGTITLITDEGLPFYWRLRLNEYLAGDLREGDLLARSAQWYEERSITLRLESTVIGGDAKETVVVTNGGEKIRYDKLLIATGSHSFIPPIAGSAKQGVWALRTIKDAQEILKSTKRVEMVVVIGGGLLGLEAGNALRRLGKEVVVVEFFPRLLPRQLDNEGAKRLQDMMEAMGFSFRLGAKTQGITGAAGVNGVALEGGELLPAQMVIISAGVRPNLALVGPLGLKADKGIIVSEHLSTNQADIYAAGDVAEFQGMLYGIWPAAMEQGRIAGANMAGNASSYHGTTMANTLKVVGIDLASAGEIDADNKHESIVVSDAHSYKKIVIDDNRIIGCIMLGDKRNFNRLTELIANKQDVSSVKNEILSEGFDFEGL